MGNLTNLEVSKRIAKIEGVEVVLGNKDENYWTIYINERDPFETKRYGKIYNPVEDDALCHKLMIKYGIKFEPCPIYENMYLANGKCADGFNILPKVHENNPNMAICLAIIKMHESFFIKKEK